MATKIFKIRWNSSVNLTKRNVADALHKYFYDDFDVKELLKTPKVALDLIKKMKRKTKRV